jgi:hypothetical protein
MPVECSARREGAVFAEADVIAIAENSPLTGLVLSGHKAPENVVGSPFARSRQAGEGDELRPGVGGIIRAATCLPASRPALLALALVGTAAGRKTRAPIS